MSKPIKIAIFASGSGSNAEKIMHYFRQSRAIQVACVISNRQQAGVLDRAKKYEVPALVYPKQHFTAPNELLNQLQNFGVDAIVLAGFLLKIPQELIRAFPNKIINIHPALLPKYGGQGMYGIHVHEAVLANQEHESGITIHLVNEHYDEGIILFQAACPIAEGMKAEEVAAKVLQLEHQHYPKVIENYLLSL